MCTPTLAIAAVTLATTIAATGVAIAQTVEEAEAAEDQADFIADKARYEGVILERAKKVELIKNGIAARRAYGRIRTQLAASGNDLGFGSTAKLLREVVRFQSLDQSLIAQNAQNAAIGLRLQADVALFGGRSARSAAAFKGIGLGLSGAASAGSIFTSNLRAQQQLDAVTNSPRARRAVLSAPAERGFA